MDESMKISYAIVIFMMFLGLFIMTTQINAQVTEIVPVDYNINFNGDGEAIWKTDTGYKCLAWDNYEIYHATRTRLKAASEQTILDELTAYESPLTPEQEIRCQALYDANPFPLWIVKPNRTYLSRPVKRIINNIVDISDTIGRVNIGQQCGREVQSNTSTMWREVTITYPDNSVVIGASVCEQQP